MEKRKKMGGIFLTIIILDREWDSFFSALLTVSKKERERERGRKLCGG